VDATKSPPAKLQAKTAAQNRFRYTPMAKKKGIVLAESRNTFDQWQCLPHYALLQRRCTSDKAIVLETSFQLSDQ
jgi:hypothetical protein